MTKVLLVGFSCHDLVFAVDTLPSRGEKYRARALDVVGGGLAANAAVAVARLGGAAQLITYLGDDGVGRDILDELQREGVDCTLSKRFTGARSPTSAIAVDRAGERMILNYADPSYPGEADWLPADLAPDVNAVLGDSRWEAGSLALFQLARRLGVPAVLDADRALKNPETARSATHVAWSAQGLREASGITDLREALAAEAARNANWTAVTDGAAGCWFTEDGTIAHEPAFKIEAVDTLGAGDTFHGALALALGEGQVPRRAVRFAAAAAALKCTRFGGRRGIPTRAEVEALLATC